MSPYYTRLTLPEAYTMCLKLIYEKNFWEWPLNVAYFPDKTPDVFLKTQQWVFTLLTIDRLHFITLPFPYLPSLFKKDIYLCCTTKYLNIGVFT